MRPHAWWLYDAIELRRAIGRDQDQEDGHDDGRLPAFEDPELPEECKKNYYGRPNIADGFIYEGEREYLHRLNLLKPIENRFSRNFDEIVFVRMSPGTFGECNACWTEARETAKEIGFDLDGAALPHNTFWIPDKFVF
jgi:hypothetical protein